MFIVRVFVNLAILCLEVGAVIGVGALGYLYPLVFAALTFALALGLGARLEFARLKNELNFYFERKVPVAGFFTAVVALSEALLKAILAGLVALLTFSGTDQGRLYLVAIIFAACVFIGSSVLRWLANRFNVTPGRWGYFRIAGPLGLIFSLALAFLPAPSFAKLGWELMFNLPSRFTFDQEGLKRGSEMLFMLKQKFDELFYTLLTTFVGEHGAAVIGVLTSVNMLTGFIIAIYAMVISETVRWLENR